MATPTPSELERKAKEAFFDDDFALAAALYTQAIAAGAPSAAFYADRAQAYIKMGDFAAGAADAARAAELDPAMPRAHLRRAHACVKLEQYDAARAAVEAGAALAPADARLAQRFAQLMKEIDAKASKPMETEASAAAPVPAAAPAEKAKYRHDYYNSAAEVVVTVFAKGMAPEHVAVEFGEQVLSISVEVPGELPYHLQPRLFGKVVPDKCRFAVLSTKIEVRLAKAEPGTTWTSLEFTDKPRFIAAAPPSGSNSAGGGAKRPSYPSSKGRKDWDKIEAEVKKAEKEEKLDGDAAANKFFKDIFSNADEDMRRAMTKSYLESNGTVLSTNWEDVGSKKIEPSPPEGMDLRKWEY
ncbi:Protein SGT1-like protein [Dichanthelium oligosanthes]|uniref:Protein SGT1 homolog n=1 Tax=Dichanthelium oligosanthes TaxID=888268 RepID=A0A1E5VZN4_9POAL|nr:Protein SGT1-like protein [Dichanthelium oligosanthes]